MPDQISTEPGAIAEQRQAFGTEAAELGQAESASTFGPGA